MRLSSQLGRALLIAATLALGAAGRTAAAQTDEAESAALRAQFDQIRALVREFDERLTALEARQRAGVRAYPSEPLGATGAGTAGVNVAGAPANAVSAPPPQPAVAERGNAPTTSSGVASTAATPDRHSWRQVASGATQADVARLLGQPTTAFQLPGKTVWYYYYPATGAGSVFFDSTGHTSSVQRPATGW